MLDTISAKKGKIIKISVLFLLMLMFLTACDPYTGRRPYDYPNSIWVCETPYIYAWVDDYGIITAYIGKGEEKLYIDLCFDYSSGVEAIKAEDTYVSDENLLFSGDCFFHKTHFTVFLIKDNLWNGAYSRLKFVRQP